MGVGDGLIALTWFGFVNSRTRLSSSFKGGFMADKASVSFTIDPMNHHQSWIVYLQYKMKTNLGEPERSPFQRWTKLHPKMKLPTWS